MIARADGAGIVSLAFADEAPGKAGAAGGGGVAEQVAEDVAEDAAEDVAARRWLAELERQIGEYFAGTRREFDLPLDPAGTDFQKKAWRQLTTIPFGTTISYAEQAAALGSPRAVRAVASANARNPIAIVVPCHRVIGKDGSLTGYSGGLDRKRALLDLERGGA